MSRALDVGGWRVLPLACVDIGSELVGSQRPTGAHPLASDRVQAVLAEALIASVCHSTNWDTLRHHILDSFSHDGPAPAVLAGISEIEFRERYGPAFVGAHTELSLADDLRARYRIFQAVATAFAKDRLGIKFDGGGNTLGGTDGLISGLSALPGFDIDPEGKKLRVFFQNLIRHRLVHFKDPDSLAPAIEYHIIRLYLRTGRVVPNTRAAEYAVAQNGIRTLGNVSALRRAVSEAMRITAESAGLSLIEINDIEWQIARSLCVREAARCDGPPLPSKPLSNHLSNPDGGCLFKDVCAASLGQVPKTWAEPRLPVRHASIY